VGLPASPTAVGRRFLSCEASRRRPRRCCGTCRAAAVGRDQQQHLLPHAEPESWNSWALTRLSRVVPLHVESAGERITQVAKLARRRYCSSVFSKAGTDARPTARLHAVSVPAVAAIRGESRPRRFLAALPGDVSVSEEFRHRIWDTAEVRPKLAAKNVACATSTRRIANRAIEQDGAGFSSILRLRRPCYDEALLGGLGPSLRPRLAAVADRVLYSARDIRAALPTYARRLL